ncbi:hypothetical protein DFQ28_006554 [Apophysomyces sp. BC1034]|nr:hypothetical protein DFQ30_006754 [Apophysomyces sp. BC1015]KAG0176782.1 hypothetical protein DFQ29_005649 [Apophysomyces sp. BC1021]KAG0187284.1 hypothetical protein DFQ28_006554 [Apophysomyces sp. BC1034]
MKAPFLLSAALLGFLACSTSAAPVDPADGLPPIILERTRIVSKPAHVDLNAEERAMAHNGKLPEDAEQKAGMALDATEGPRYEPKKSKRTTVTTATAEQMKDLEYFTYICSDSYYTSVIPGGRWDCEHCNKTGDGVKLVTTFKSKLLDTNGFIARSDKKKQIDVVFRGTVSNVNWLADFTFVPVNYPPVEGAKVHAGFYHSYQDVAKSVIPLVQKQLDEYPDYEVVVAGHSLGAALAVVGVLDLYQREPRLNADNLRLFTYGGPRVGNPDFAYYAVGTGIKWWRSVHERDVVPHMPPQAFGYLHPGLEFWINDEKNVVQVCQSDLETDSCSNSIVPFTNWPDHTKYYDILIGPRKGKTDDL